MRAGRPHDSRQDAGATPTRLGVLFPPLYTGTVKIALGQINPTVGDFSGNAAKIIDFAHQAQAAGAGLILFPELSVCGYPPRDLVERSSFVTHNRETAERIAIETRGIAVVCGLVTPAQAETGKSVMNSAALLKDGKLAFLQSKMLLPTYDVFDEMRNFAPAKSQLLFPFCGKQMALTICEDAWNDKHFWNRRLYGFDPVESLMSAGGNFLLNIGPMPSGKIQPEFVERLHGIGRWIEHNGESIYGTRGGPLAPTSWGATTQRDGKIYIHVMDYAGDLLALSKLPPVKSAKVLSSGAGVEVTEIQGGIVLHLPQTRDDADTVIVLDTAR